MDFSLLERLEQLQRPTVLCVGDIMLDHYVYGDVERISPEAPVPVLSIRHESAMLGGVGNVVRNIAALDGRAFVVSVIGNDKPGADIKTLADQLPNVTASLIVDKSRPTTLKIRYVAGNGNQLLRADHERVHQVDDAIEASVIESAREFIANCDAVIVSDYVKGVVTPAVVQEVIAMARKKGVPVIIDPKGREWTRYRGATVLTPNRKELADVTGMKVSTRDEVRAAAGQLISQYDVPHIIAKLGSEGVGVISRDRNNPEWIGSNAREVFDVSGAGDTVAATLGVFLSAGSSVEEAARFANLAASYVVGKVGTAVVTRKDLFDLLAGAIEKTATAKVLSRERAAEIAAIWRRQGLRVGFTNGCFDLLHPGHLASLGDARAACDRLIVGVNSDASVKRLKGETRPIQNEESRSIVLASLACVDGVVIFGEDTPFELISAIQPDVMVKGGDYTVEQVVGADIVLARGGKVIIAPILEGHSTTKTVAKMAS